LPSSFTIILTSGILILVDIWEDQANRHNEQIVNGEDGNHEVPQLAEGSIRVNEVPLQLWLTVDDLVLLVSIFVDIVDHHLFQI
jgi:hypothetical protein